MTITEVDNFREYMAFEQHGSTSYKFAFNSGEASAIATACGLKPQSIDFSAEPEFVAEAEDEKGEVASVVVGQAKHNFTMSGYIIDATDFAACVGSSFTFRSKNCIITGAKETDSNRDFQKGEVTGVAYAGVPVPTP